MTPTRIGDEWFVTRADEQLAGPFKTNGDAWRWMDRHAGEPISKAEQRSGWLFDQMELHGAASNAAATPSVTICGNPRNSAALPPERYGNAPSRVTERDMRDTYSRGYHIFADGAAVPNPGEGGWGVVVYLDGVEVEAMSGGDPVTTNNRMEMTALLIAIETARRFGAPVTIWSDSQYCVNGANDWRHKWKRHGWRKSPRATEFVKNAELWQAIDAALVDASMSGGITIKWVKGHAGIVGNERADELAEIGAAGRGRSRQLHDFLASNRKEDSMTIAERQAREAYDRENPWRPMKDVKADGLICELLFNDMAGDFITEGLHYFLDAEGHWYRIDPLSRIRLTPINWRPAYVRLTPERRNLLKRRIAEQDRA